MSDDIRFEQMGIGSARKRLVLADDDAVVRSMLSIQLQQAFDVVGTAADAEEAIALVERDRPDVVILDARALADRCKALEAVARGGSLEGAAQLVDEIEAAFADAHAALLAEAS